MQNNEFLDENIIEMIDQAEQPEAKALSESGRDVPETPKEERTIYTGIKILGQWIEFEERLFVDDKIAMMVPVEFEDMDIEMAKVKYPMEQRPDTILTDSTGAINILLTFMDTPMENEEAETVRDEMLRIMCRMNPGIKKQSVDVDIVSEKNVAYAEFTNPALDGKLYNQMYFMELEGMTLMGGFNCLTKSAKYWKNPALEMMRSIRIVDEIEEEQADE